MSGLGSEAMAEQTSSSITIDAPPADVMAVIADFESYPSGPRACRPRR